VLLPTPPLPEIMSNRLSNIAGAAINNYILFMPSSP
jgi:hypothetical protein